MNPYRSEQRIRILIDFSEYYEDAIAIGFSYNKAIDYAFKCCMEEKNRLESLISSGTFDRYEVPWKIVEF